MSALQVCQWTPEPPSSLAPSLGQRCRLVAASWPLDVVGRALGASGSLPRQHQASAPWPASHVMRARCSARPKQTPGTAPLRPQIPPVNKHAGYRLPGKRQDGPQPVQCLCRLCRLYEYRVRQVRSLPLSPSACPRRTWDGARFGYCFLFRVTRAGAAAHLSAPWVSCLRERRSSHRPLLVCADDAASLALCLSLIGGLRESPTTRAPGSSHSRPSKCWIPYLVQGHQSAAQLASQGFTPATSRFAAGAHSRRTHMGFRAAASRHYMSPFQSQLFGPHTSLPGDGPRGEVLTEALAGPWPMP